MIMWDTRIVVPCLQSRYTGDRQFSWNTWNRPSSKLFKGNDLNYVALLSAHESSNWNPISNFGQAISLALGCA